MLSPWERQAIARLFNYSQEYLWDGRTKNRYSKHKHICGALWKAAQEHRAPWDIRSIAQRVILDRLGDHIYVEQWLRREVGIKFKDLKKKRVQAWRLAWLKALEKEFSE
jgi:hypothetical protein